MGNISSYPGLTEDLLEDYASLTYLSEGEIMYLLKKFNSIDPAKMEADFHHRFSKEEILEKFTVLKNNPFQDRLFSVFSSKNDNCFSFEDMVDLCSAMSSECPDEVKAAWAFKVFDIDEDNQISEQDIGNILDRITHDVQHPGNKLDANTKKTIANTILKEIKLDGSGSIGLNEFKLFASRLPEFKTAFYYRL